MKSILIKRFHLYICILFVFLAGFVFDSVLDKNGKSVESGMFPPSTWLMPPAGSDGTASLLGDLPRIKAYTSGRVSSYDRTGGNRDAFPIKPGETITLCDIDGPGAITHIWNTISAEAFYGRKIILRAYWDDEKQPSIEAPIGDFFGVGHGLNRNYTSLPFTVSSKGRARNSFWIMPFKKKARLEVTNEGSRNVGSFYYYIDYRLYDNLPDDFTYFHAQYRQQMPCKPGENYVLLEAEGSGHYVGTALSILNHAAGWWGEGDDMIYIDGSAKPVMNGTGSEDYFSDAWGMRESMSQFYGCPLQETDFRTGAKASVYRFHIPDPIPFKKSIRVTIEHGHANDRSDDFSSMAYWYQKEPHAPFPAMPPVAERMPYAVEYQQNVIPVDSLIPPLSYSGDAYSVDSSLYYNPSGARLKELNFNFDAPGDHVKLPVKAQYNDKYHLKINLRTGKKYGKFKVSIGDNKYSRIIDCYAKKDRIKEIVFENSIFSGAETPVLFEVTGKHPESIGYQLNLFGIALEPLREFVKNWNIIGPFDNPNGNEGLRHVYPPERKIDFSKTYSGKGNKPVSWRTYSSEKDFIDFDALFSPNEYTVAYGLTYVYAKKDTKTYALVGSDDGVRLWINDELVHDNLIKRGPTIDQDRIAVKLKEGWNKVLIKVEEAGGWWGFYFRIADPENSLRFSPEKN